MTDKKSSTKTKQSLTMADLLAKQKSDFRGFRLGETVEGKVLEITPKSLILDIGGKSEGIVAQKAFVEAKDLIKGLKVGDKVTGRVIVTETYDGYTVISLRDAAKNFIWSRIDEAKAKDSEINVEVTSANPSGLVVEVLGMSGFIPSSQLGYKTAAKSANLVGKSIKAKIIEVDKNSNRVILSEKLVSEAQKVKSLDEAIKKIKIGDVFEGEVVSIYDFGAFVKFGYESKSDEKVTLEGLVHVSEISWDKVDKAADVLTPKDKVRVKVIDIKNGKISLSIKQAQEDPWTKVAGKYQIDDKVAGKVVKISDFGVFVSLEPGVEGLIHMTKIPPATKFKTGDEVNCYIEEIDTKEKRISLGLALSTKPLGYK